VLKVVSFSPIPEGIIRSFFAPASAKYKLDLNIVVINQLDMNLIRKEFSDADYVIGDYSFKVPINSEMIEAAKKVKLIQQPSTGFDHIDIAAAKRRRIPVSNIGGANAVSVAEHNIALALNLLKRIVYGHSKLLRGEWSQAELMNVSSELFGKTWGVIGLGRIGKETSRRAKALGANTIYFDIVRNPEEESKSGIVFRPLQRLLSEAEVVSIHTPLTPETTRMIGEKELRLMKPTSVFLNTSRGELVDEFALAKALRERWIAGAGVDVFSKEPPPSDHPLILAAKDNAPMILTPHIAGATNDARMRIIQFTIENVVRVMMGGNPENVVNP
jgi:phosphoglycerate dehydrogenase-like enzyme